MDADAIADLKQFMTTTIGQQTFDITERLDGMEERFDGIDERFDKMDKRFDGIDERIDWIETKIDDLTAFVADALDASNEATELWLQDHEHRITKLEQKPI